MAGATLGQASGCNKQAQTGEPVTERCILAKILSSTSTPRPGDIPRMVEQVLGCKWTVRVLSTIRAGVYRPGAMEREVAGISTKVLNERLRKLVRLGIVERRAYPEIPPRVEYRLSRFGRRFTRILDAVESLQQELGELRYPPRP